MKKANLIAHCGTHLANEEMIRSLPEVPRTKTWNPVHHADVIDVVQDSLHRADLVPINKRYSISENGMKMFGAWDIAQRGNEDMTWAVGIRNAMDKSMCIGLMAGTRVFVCDNLAFSSDGVVIKRKHTGRLTTAELVFLMDGAIIKLQGYLGEFQEWHEDLHNYELNKYVLREMIFAAMHDRVLPPSKFAAFCELVYEGKEGEDPTYEPTLYGFHGANTELHKNLSLVGAYERNRALNGLIQWAKGEYF